MKRQGIKIEKPSQAGFDLNDVSAQSRCRFNLWDYSLLSLTCVMAVINLFVVFFAHWL